MVGLFSNFHMILLESILLFSKPLIIENRFLSTLLEEIALL